MDHEYGLWNVKTLDVKALDVASRTFSGLASTPDVDRQGHIVDPAGVTFRNPLPLLFHHDQTQPIGTVTLTKTAAGIAFEARLPIIATAGRLKDRIDDVWQTVQAGLMSNVSIGFRILDGAVEHLKGGITKLLRTEIVELSLVTIPANMHASITLVKSLAAIGPDSPGVTGSTVVRVKGAKNIMTTAEQIIQWSNTRAPKAARMADLMAKSAEKGETLNDTESQEFDGLEAEVKSIDTQLSRLRTAEQLQIATATAVSTTTKSFDSRGSTPVISIKSNVAPATGFIRYCQAMAMGKGSQMEAANFAAQQKSWRDSTPEVELMLKAAVAPGTTTDATWAGPLAAMTNLTNEFLELLRPATVLGKIPGLKRVPFNVSIAMQTAGGTYQWVGQGAPKPVGKLAFSAVTLGITKCAGIIVITEELARTSSPSAESTIRADMIAGIAAFLDLEFTDPAKAPVANVSPGSVTNGVTPITSTGTTPANARADLQALIAAINAAGLSTAQVVVLMSEANAMALGFALNPLGQPMYPGLGVNGGTALGMTIVTSNALGNRIIALDPNSILYADDGGVTIDASREASVQMDTAPTNPADATTVMTSFWQNNLIGLRAERFINWKKARAGSVQFTTQTYVG